MISYGQHLDSCNQKRIEYQRWLYEYYIGKEDSVIAYLDDALSVAYDSEDIQDFIKDWVNITEKLINQSAIVYQESAQRKVLLNDKVNLKLTDYYNNILPLNINTKNKTAQRYAKLFDTSLTHIGWRNGRSNYITLPSHYFNVSCSDDDPFKAVMVSYSKDFADKRGDWQTYQVFWTDTEHYMVHIVEYSDGKYVYDGGKLPVPTKEGKAANKAMVNPYNIIPFAVMRLREGSEFWGEGQTDAVTVNEIVNVLLTGLLNNDIILGSRGFPVFKNTKKGTLAGNVRWGIKHPLVVEGEPGGQEVGVDFVNANTQIQAIRDTIDWKIRMIGIMKGLDPNKFLADVKAVSGFSKIMDSLEMIEIRRDDLEPCRIYEDDCFNINRAINNSRIGTTEGKGLVLIPEDAYVQVDFAEIKMPMTAKEKREDSDWKLSKNLINIIDLAKEDNPDIEEKELEIQLVKNKETNDRLLTRPEIKPLIDEKAQEAQQD